MEKLKSNITQMLQMVATMLATEKVRKLKYFACK